MHYFLDRGFTLYANYNLYEIPYTRIDSVKDFEDVETPYNIFSIDEAWLSGLDSRRSQSFINVALSETFLQSGKMGMGEYRINHIIITGQDFGQFDLRIRNVTDIVAKPTIIVRDEFNKPLAMLIEYINYQSDNKKRQRLPIPLQFEFEHGFVDVPNSYDTYQRIESMEEELAPNNEIVQKYLNFEGNKGELISVLEAVEHIPTTPAKTLASFISCVKKGYVK
jgi:hypothetical protein